MSNVKKVQRMFQTKGPLVHVQTAPDGNIVGYYVYMVYNGDQIPQIGHGSGDRLARCMRGSIAKKHNKAFICALTETIFGRPNRYCYVKIGSKQRAKKFETEVHAALGIRTNMDGATVIEGVLSTTIKGIHQELWKRTKTLPIYQELTVKEKMMAEELFRLVTYDTTKVTRSSGAVVCSRQGDNLEGNILMNVRKAYLIHIYQKLTDNYHRYGKHKLSEAKFEAILRDYSYSPQTTSPLAGAAVQAW